MSLPLRSSSGPGSEPALIRARATDHLSVAVGTTEGLFIVREGVIEGPHFDGSEVPAFAQVGERYVAAPAGRMAGATIRTSDDGGATWNEPANGPIGFPADTGAVLAQIAQLATASGSAGTAGALFAGVAPAALFVSPDGGETFELVQGLWDHPDRPHWTPGCGGLVLHSILTHPERPDRILVAIASGGVYRSDDAGRTWVARNSGLKERFLSGPAPEYGQCVHKIAIDASGPDVLWAQNHRGTYRSENAGDTWVPVDRAGGDGGLPSESGYAIAAHPVDAGSAFVFPLASDEHPFDPEAYNRLYRTTDEGLHWTVFGQGLPSRPVQMQVLRDAVTVGSSAPFPIIFGARTGEVFASADDGETWRSIVPEPLPPVLCVRVLH